MKDYPKITLTAGTCELELVPEFGGLCNQLALGLPNQTPIDVIAGLATRSDMETDGGYRGIPLFPIVNRLDKGEYIYEGQQYQLEQNEKALGNTLHGFLQHIKPSCTILEQSEDKAVACLDYTYRGEHQGYPFPVAIRMTYTLRKEGSLSIQFSVTNKHRSIIPVGIGWHPYFQLGQKVDELSLKLPPVVHTLVNERMLPTGEKVEFNEFKALSMIGSRKFDDCFELTANHGQTAITLWSEKIQQGIEIWQNTGKNGYNFIQVCIPPDRQSIAIEPVSCGINAFNTQEGVIHLPPNSTFTAECGVKYISSL